MAPQVTMPSEAQRAVCEGCGLAVSSALCFIGHMTNKLLRLSFWTAATRASEQKTS